MDNPAAGHLLNQCVLKAPPGCESVVRKGGHPREIVPTKAIRYAACTLCAELCRYAARKLT